MAWPSNLATSACPAWALICKPLRDNGDTELHSSGHSQNHGGGDCCLIDQFIWRPGIAWAEKFKMEASRKAATAPTSWVLDFAPAFPAASAALRKRADSSPSRTDDSTTVAAQAPGCAPNRSENRAVYCSGESAGIANPRGDRLRRRACCHNFWTGLRGSEVHQIGFSLAAPPALNVTLISRRPSGPSPPGCRHRIPFPCAWPRNPLSRSAQIAASVPAHGRCFFPVVVCSEFAWAEVWGGPRSFSLLLGQRSGTFCSTLIGPGGRSAIPPPPNRPEEAAKFSASRGWERWRTDLPGIFPFLVTG